MVTIKNIEGKSLELPFEGYTYSFPRDKVVMVEEKVADWLKEIVPLAFDFEVKVPKGELVSKAIMVKTKPMIAGQEEGPITDMKVTNSGQQVSTFNPEEGATGPGFVGPGIETEEDVV